MDAIYKEVRSLSATELRNRLLHLGYVVGPITASTLSLFQKKLAKKLLGDEGGGDVARHDGDDSVFADDTSDSPGRNTSINETNSQRGTTTERNETAGVKSGSDSSTCTSPVYYGVSLPHGVYADAECDELVFCDKVEALKAVKKYKGSRFNRFKSEDDARRYSTQSVDQSSSLVVTAVEGSSDQGSSGPAVVTEKSLFSGPKMPELVNLRRAIEQGNTSLFLNLVWSNPRYLISSGDTPVILQEGFRYNGLHSAAKANKAEMCRLIIDVLENPAFMKTLYPMDTEQTRTERIHFIADLYINTPDKGTSETPLHFACKFGHIEVVKVLAAHPKTDCNGRNKYGETPADIICSRCDATAEKRQKINDILEARVYVPLYRSEDNTTQPIIGYPCSLGTAQQNMNAIQASHSPKDPRTSMMAYAGPMSPAKANAFHKQWSTSPSGGKDVKLKFHAIRRADSDKGAERIGRKLARDYAVPWSEYWSFLGEDADMSTANGLSLLENYLCQSYANNVLHENADMIKDYCFDIKHELKSDVAESVADNEEFYDCVEYLGTENASEDATQQDTSLDIDDLTSQLMTGLRLGSVNEVNDTELCSSENRNPFVDVGGKSNSSRIPHMHCSVCQNSRDVEGKINVCRCDVNNKRINKSWTLTVHGAEYLEKIIALLIVKWKQLDETCTDISDVLAIWGAKVQNNGSDNGCDVSVNIEKANNTNNDTVSDSRTLYHNESIDQNNVKTSGIKELSDLTELFQSVAFSSCEIKMVESSANEIPKLTITVTALSTNQGDVESVTITTSKISYLKSPKLSLPTTCPEVKKKPDDVYIQGSQATKLDLDVLRAIGSDNVIINDYPQVSKWKYLVSSFNDDVRHSWPSPRVARTRSNRRIPEESLGSSPHRSFMNQPLITSPSTRPSTFFSSPVLPMSPLARPTDSLKKDCQPLKLML